MTRTLKKTYLGDGAYVEIQNGPTVVLTTEDGIRTTNEIVLDFEVLHALLSILREQKVISQ